MELRRFTTQTQLTNYIPLPRSMLSLGLPSTAVLLYGILLDRATLSQKNDYCDGAGWVYAVYPILELVQLLGLSDTSIKNSLRLLEQHGLIRRVRNRRREANRVYLFIPSDAVQDTGTGTSLPSEGKKSASGTGRKVPPNNIIKQQEFINPYQHSEEESL